MNKPNVSNHEKSALAFAEAKQYIPGGVNSPVRAFKSVDRSPLFMKRGSGSRIFDIDGNSYIDYIGSWGPLIVGHAHPEVIAVIQETAADGTSFGAPTLYETEMAKLVIDRVPSIESVRMVNSGTEATMSALRLARGYTGRNMILKFEGGYHGHADALLIKAGSGVATLGLPDSPGVPESVAVNTITVPYNDLSAVQLAFEKYPVSIAAVILEPVAGNMGVVAPIPGYLQGLRELTTEHGALLIFDEVMTGFRVGINSAQGLYNVIPDLTCLGKVIGGGLPVGAYGGRREIMDMIAPSGPIYQAGTLSGNPLAMVSGLKTLELLGQPGVYEELERRSARLEEGLRESAAEAGIPICINRVGAMMSMFFTDKQVVNFETANTSDLSRFKQYFSAMIDQGISIAPSQFEAIFISTAHSDDDIEQTIKASKEAFKKLSK